MYCEICSDFPLIYISIDLFIVVTKLPLRLLNTPMRHQIFCFLLLSYSLKYLVAIGGIQLLLSDLEGRRVSLSKCDLGEGEGVLCQCGRLPVNF